MSYTNVYPSRINWENYPAATTPIDEVNLNKMDYALYVHDQTLASYDTTKANQSDLLLSVKSIDYDTETGVFVFTWQNGTTKTVDLNIEKIPVSFSMSAQGVITMTTDDGTSYTADVGSLIKTYTFSDSTQVDFTVTTDQSGNKTVVAGIVAGSITETELQPQFLSDCQAAQSAAETAQGFAEDSAEDAEAWAVGQRGGVDVPSTDPAYHNNAKYYSEESVHTTFASLTDVSMSNLQNGQIPVYNSTSGKWENGTGGGGASLPIDISSSSNVTGILNIANGGTGNSSGYVRAGQKANTSIGHYATAEGYNTTASGGYCHAEGYMTISSGSTTHAEGDQTTASASTTSHAEGGGTTASGSCSHAEGYCTTASGMDSHAEGYYTIAKGNTSHVQGKYNIQDDNDTYAHIVGNGTASNARSNAHTLDWNGNAWFAGNVTDGSGNKLSDISNKHKVSNFEVSTTGWTADTTSQSGTTLYKKQVSLSHVYANPSVDIGASTGNVLPTTAEQTAYDLVQYVTVDDTVPCLYLYASDTPTNSFNIDVEGVD